MGGKEKIFVLTGATGFLGSHLMAALIARGERIIVLGRSKEGKAFTDRVAELLAWFGLAGSRERIRSVEADFLKSSLGLTAKEYGALCAAAAGGQIIHCASDTRFSEQNRRESMDTNVHSLIGITGLAKDMDASFFHYISTAYVCSGETPLCLETPVNTHAFANIYEETKALAEREVTGICREHGIPFTILRPAIVYGDFRTGRANHFSALYYHVKSLYYIREIYVNDIERHGGRKSDKWGIYLDGEGTLHMRLRIFFARHGTVNLIPIDYFVAAAISILEHAEPSVIYHITSDTPRTTEELASYCGRYLKIKGIEPLYRGGPDGSPMNPPEALFNRFIEPYRPYLTDFRTFDRANTNRVTPGIYPPVLTYEVFERCMDYAVSLNWGNRKWRSGPG